MKFAIETNESYRLGWVLPSTQWNECLLQVKAIPGAVYDPNKKLWDVPKPMRGTVERLGFQIKSLPDLAGVGEPPAGLRHYQLEAMEFLKRNRGRGLIADEMGTGKTIMALAWAYMLPKQRPVLVIVRAPTKLQWEKQIRRWCPGASIYVCSGKTIKTTNKTFDFYVINWDILESWCKKQGRSYMGFDGCKISPALVISDEVQAVCNPSALRTKAWNSVVRKAPMHIALSGTPFTTAPLQFYSIMHDLAPNLFPSYHRFRNRYGGPKWTPWGIKYDGASNIDELKELTKPFFIRRTKAEVLPELPDKSVEAILMDVPKATMTIDEFKDMISQKIDSKLPLSVDTLFLYNDKRDAVIKYIRTWLEDSDKKLIVFAWHRFVVDDIAKEFSDHNALKFYGGIGETVRQDIIDTFKGVGCRLLICNMASGGVGIDGLQDVCDTAFFVEFSRTPATLVQAEDRLHRIGQKSAVDIRYLIAKDSIEEEWSEIVCERGRIIADILGDSQDLLKLSLTYGKEKNG